MNIYDVYYFMILLFVMKLKTLSLLRYMYIVQIA